MSVEEWLLAHARTSSKPHRKLKLDDIMSFFHQLSTLVEAGTPLLQALRISSTQSESQALRRVLKEVAERVAAGSTFHAAACNYPKVFEFAWLEVIRTGEVTGKMSHVLKELNRQVREQRETKKKVKGAMMYPIIMLAVASLALTAMLWFVVPTFDKMFKEMGAELPGLTQMVVDASRFVSAYGLYIVAGLIGLVVAVKFYLRTEGGRRWSTTIFLAMPTVGDMLVQAAMYRFASNLALLLKSGVPMLETLDTLRGIFGRSPVYRDALGRARTRVAAGQPLGTAVEETGLFTAMILSMVRIGEESGQLANVMEQIAPYYKEKMETMITKVSKMLEPIIIVGMGSAVAVMMLSIYLPMFEMSGKVK